MTNEGKALFKELELDKNPAVTLYVCEVQVPSDESCNNKTVFIDNRASLIAVFEGAKNTEKKTLQLQSLFRVMTLHVRAEAGTCSLVCQEIAHSIHLL